MEENKNLIPDETEMTWNADNNVELNEVVISDESADFGPPPVIGIAIF